MSWSNSVPDCSGGSTLTQQPQDASFDLGFLLDEDPVAFPSSQPDCIPALPVPISLLKLHVGGGDVEMPSRFKPPMSKDIIQQLSSKTFAENTQRKVAWAVSLLDSWCQNRLRMPSCCHEIQFCNIMAPSTVTKSHLAKVLTYFVTEIRCKDGGEYEGRTLYDIIICLQFHFERAGIFWKFIDDSEFQNLKWTLDNLMKEHCTGKLGTKTRASPISFEEENKMWLCGALGEDTPDKLRNTVLFLIGMSCALRSGEEHRRLRCPPFNPQIQVKRDIDGTEFLAYTEDERSKTFQGGLYSCPKKSKIVPIHGNKLRPDRDLVRLYQKYISLLPANGKSQALYKFSVSPNRQSPCTWYTDKPLGVNSLKKVVKTIAQQAGLTGKFLNHSLRATTATRLYQGGVDEQTIKEVTGHKSDAVRMYKHSNTQVLREALRKIVSETSENNMSKPGSSY